MEINVISKNENKLLSRVEVSFKVIHHDSEPPKRGAVRDKLADVLGAKKDGVVVESVKPEYGRREMTGQAHIYNTKEDALKIEREHILIRNGLVVKKEEKKA